MPFHYVWLLWASAFLLPWIALYVANPRLRAVMWRASLATSALGLSEPLFVPEYWNPPSLFELAQRTGFDIESLIFSFAIGGVGVVLYHPMTRTRLVPVPAPEMTARRHRLHRLALIVPAVVFVPLAILPWNIIYAAMVALVVGSAASVLCRPRLAQKTLIGGMLFLGFYAVFMLGLEWSAPGYIGQVWNLSDLSGLLIAGIPIEEFLFGATFGMYWSGVYEHFTWTESARHSPPDRDGVRREFAHDPAGLRMS